MRIAVCWNQSIPLAKVTVRHDLYVAGFRALGHDAFIVCPQAAVQGAGEFVHAYQSIDQPRSADFWRAMNVDALVMVTWLVMKEELMAARAAGARTIAIADSDGQIGLRTHWRAVLRRSILQHDRLRDRLAATKYFAQRWLRAGEESHRVRDSISASDCVIFNTQAAAQNVAELLKRTDAKLLSSRFGVCPYPVDGAYANEPVQSRTPPSLIAVGRWDARQKNAPLLAGALDRFYAAGGTARAEIFGASHPSLDSLAARRPLVGLRGQVSPEALAAAMHAASILLLPSRWESGPIAAFEALSSGCTIVSTPIPNLREMLACGSYGRCAASHNPVDFERAIAGEVAAWQRGDRQAPAIAGRWRNAFTPINVCRAMLEMLDRPRAASLSLFALEQSAAAGDRGNLPCA